MVQIQSLAWELHYIIDVVIKKKKKKIPTITKKLKPEGDKFGGLIEGRLF